jgi:hypothetical protein
MKLWTVIVALAVAVVTVLNLVQAVRHVPPPPIAVPGRPPANIVRRQEARFAALRTALETRGIRGPVGYIADLAPPAMNADHRSMEEYFTAQFVLVPFALDQHLGNCTWAIANLHTQPAAARMPAGFTVAQDFGDGVLLLRKTAP